MVHISRGGVFIKIKLMNEHLLHFPVTAEQNEAPLCCFVSDKQELFIFETIQTI